MNLRDKTPVTLLQELLVKRQLTPTYTLIFNGTGTHDPLFKYEVSVAGESAIGDGKSKKEAKHEAAKLLLQKLSNCETVQQEEILDDLNVNSPYAEVLKDNAIGMLSDYCGERNLPIPDYELTRDEGLPHAKLFSFKCTVSSITTEGQSRTKKQAKQLAAMLMLEKLKKCLENIVLQLPEDTTDRLERSTEDVLLKLGDVRLKKGNTSEQLGIKINDYYRIFLEDVYPESEKLNSIKVKGINTLSLEANRDLCKDIFTELDFSYKIEEIESSGGLGAIAVVLTILGTPTWAFFASGPTFEQASLKAYTEALKFMANMSN